MRHSFFAGAYGADFSSVRPETRFECKICWHVYDPKLGDEFWQIPPGTAFAELPEHWSCPQCGMQKHDFLMLDD